MFTDTVNRTEPAGGEPTDIEVVDRAAVTEVPLHPLLAARYSPRTFDAAHVLSDGQVTALLEAARWSPSAGNSQPWRFVVGRRGEAAFDRVLATLLPFNQVWAGNAGLLVLLAAEVVAADGSPRPYASYDAGQAAAHLTAQASAEGLIVRQMAGFDKDAATVEFALPDGIEPLVVLAVGFLDESVELPESLAERERAARTRTPLAELLLDPGALHPALSA